MERGMTATELSKITSIAQGTISNIENSKIPIFPGWKKRISEVLEASEDEVFPPINQENELLKEIREIKKMVEDIKED